MAITNNIKLKKTVETLVPNNGTDWPHPTPPSHAIIHTWDIIADGIEEDRPVSILYKIMGSQTNGQSPPDLAFTYEPDYGGTLYLFHTSVLYGSANDCTDIPPSVFLYNDEEQMGILILEYFIGYDSTNKLYTLNVNGTIDNGSGEDLLFTVYSELYYGTT
jgi:hypothetical protein